MEELDLDNIAAIRVLGRGATGTVFLVADRASPLTPPFAFKVVEKDNPSAKAGAERRARWELSVLSRLIPDPHPFLPTLLGYADTPDLLAWAIPFCPAGDLNALRHSLSPDRVFSTAAIRFYLSELISALSHLHSLGIVYRDLKPENVLIQSSGHILLTDFDLSRHLRSLSFVGTEEYVSPEVVRGDGHEFAVDWWALGILAYEMAYGRTPFRGRNRNETFRNVLTRQPEFVGKHRSELTDLIARLLVKEPELRLGFSGGAKEVMAHPFFNGVKWDILADVGRPPFLATTEELEDGEVRFPARDDRVLSEFDVRDYFKKLRQKHVAEIRSPASASLTEF
ncbi:Serine/threonine-protein kinase OXI1 [Platanthera zijinensis]|uniref:non-specific serine/threonine protein kinase n=1 Tax=Platanthera zijinensis TaxID=2320716 RepID=A0AAP0GFL3_9ASPA